MSGRERGPYGWMDARAVLAAVRAEGADLERGPRGLVVLRDGRGLPWGLFRRIGAVAAELRALLAAEAEGGLTPCRACGGRAFLRAGRAWWCVACWGVPAPVPQWWSLAGPVEP